MRLAFKTLSIFWMISPILFLTGRACGIWNTHYDWLIALGFTFMSTAVAFMAYEPNKNSGR